MTNAMCILDSFQPYGNVVFSSACLKKSIIFFHVVFKSTCPREIRVILYSVVNFDLYV